MANGKFEISKGKLQRDPSGCTFNHGLHE